jgi:hypothetical protein
MTPRQLSYLLVILAMFFYSNGFAADNFYCAETSQYIKLGMSLSDVQSACGKPISEKKRKVAATKKIPISQWFYRLGTSTGGRGNETFNTGGSGTGTLIVTFEDGKVSGIKFDDISAPTSSMCDEGSIKQGDSKSAVSFACGEPNYTNDTYRVQPINQPVEVVIWTIKSSQYAAPTQLTFRNGVLESIGN